MVTISDLINVYKVKCRSSFFPLPLPSPAPQFHFLERIPLSVRWITSQIFLCAIATIYVNFQLYLCLPVSWAMEGEHGPLIVFLPRLSPLCE